MQQTRHKLLREALHTVLRDMVHAGPDAAHGIVSVPSRAVAALYQVLLNHPIDRRGRCRSCRRPGTLFGRRRRRCRVYFDVVFWLHQPDPEMLLVHLRQELRQRRPESSSRTPAVPAVAHPTPR
ncbi:MAG TPA: hypothetical protein VHH34_16315, partial [Pseudonocardiaceae bacterium]|nr:hypothetical protein [Pseudonocardiaceae bacterium]